jgi:hypothetical protein
MGRYEFYKQNGYERGLEVAKNRGMLKARKY